MSTTEGMRRRFAAMTAATTLALILAGGFVTTTATGDTVPEWPFLMGRLKPGFLIEWTHRSLGMIVGLMTLALALWTQLREPRAWVRQLAWLAFGGAVVQGLLGGLRVYADRHALAIPKVPVAIIHACFAQVIFCAVTTIAVSLTKMWASTGRDEEAASARTLGGIAVGVAFLQLVAGAVTRHTGGGLAVHVVGAVLVLLFVSLFASRLMLTSVRGGAHLVLAILGVQIALGLAAWAIRSSNFVRSHESPVVPIVTVTSHVAVGAALLASTLVLALRCHRAAAAPVAELEAAGS